MDMSSNHKKKYITQVENLEKMGNTQSRTSCQNTFWHPFLGSHNKVLREQTTWYFSMEKTWILLWSKLVAVDLEPKGCYLNVCAGQVEHPNKQGPISPIRRNDKHL